ncbi:MAG: glycoside hydrolase family 15 protein [Methylobacter sp.]
MHAQNSIIKALIQSSYTMADLENIEQLFHQYATLDFIIKPNGLYAALTTEQMDSVSGYTYTWIRDAIMITNYQYEVGALDTARKTVTTLRDYFDKHRDRFVDIIEGYSDKEDPMQRPHIRFIGDTLEEVKQQWAHAENDALGYALWMAFHLANHGELELNEKESQVFALFPFYFEAIEYWRDPDNGHWEEERKIESSSIGVVVAALMKMRCFMLDHPTFYFKYGDINASIVQLDRLITKGQEQLDDFLPYESPPQRLADGALLFLIYPLNVVSEEQADEILRVVLADLKGDYGIKRYLGDSYWCADYKSFFKEEERTVDFSGDMERRDKFLKPGTEAQWCIFDPIVSIIFGRRYLQNNKLEDLEKQTHFFNRALSQITSEEFRLGGGKCAEAYYIENSVTGLYVPNDHVPLGWTQANLGTALEYMKRSLSHKFE